jgi:predicted transposase YbfD/YdcC
LRQNVSVEIAAMGTKFKSLACHLGALPDPRKVKGRRHVLLDVLVIAVLAALCGIDDWESTVYFARGQEDWLRTFLALPNGIPSHDTFNRIFRMLDPRAFGEAFLAWVGGIREKIPEDVVAFDGKTLRASLCQGKPPLHVVSAWSVGNGMVLGQRAVDEKSNEIKAIPELVKILDLRGCIVTIDAMGCQKAIVEEIVARKADYVLAVKADQERLFEAIQASFATLDADPSAVPHFSTESQEEGHGRKEFRRVTIVDGVHRLPEDILFSWPRLETLMRIQTVTQRGDKVEREERFFISSMPMRRAETIARCPRLHWGIESRRRLPRIIGWSLCWASRVATTPSSYPGRRPTSPSRTPSFRSIRSCWAEARGRYLGTHLLVACTILIENFR